MLASSSTRVPPSTMVTPGGRAASRSMMPSAPMTGVGSMSLPKLSL